jgi:beta-galactosidase
MNMGRTIQNINTGWKFFRGDEPRAWYKGLDDSNWREVTIPHDWSVEEPFSQEHSSGTGYLPGGTGWYRKTFYLSEDVKNKKVYITFDGVYNNSQVWCNSYYIGKRPYGYSPFTYDITDFVVFGDEGNVISVKVNHKDIADSRWFTGTGIYRDVHITITDPVHIDKYGVFVTTPEVSEDKATVNINICLSNDSAEDEDINVNISLWDENGHEIAITQESAIAQGGTGKNINRKISVQRPRLWSPDTPHLYSVLTGIAKCGEVVDHVETQLGIRRFEFDADRGFFLNGVNLKIKGVCLHHDAGCLGAAVPEKVWARRLEALKDMGCNAIRMSHNPPASNLLDLCDKMGFLVMDEAFDEWEGVKNKWSTGHNVYPPKHFGYYEDFPEWSETDIKEMVLRDRNHPSVILWSIGNEVDYPNDPYCHPSFKSMTGNNDANKPLAEKEYDPARPNAERLTTIAKRLVRFVKECDTTRPVTAALAFPELSNLTGYAQALDVVGYNYKEHLYAEDYVKYPGRVTYGSENGPGLEEWLAVRDNNYICGQFIWTGIDYMGEAKGWPIRAAQSGFLDLAGNKKAKYFYRQSLWSQKPMVYLSLRKKDNLHHENNRRWDGGEPHWNWKAGEQVEVICYTNCKEAELFINDKSLGIKQLEDFPQYYLSWDTSFEEGILKAVAKNGDGRICSCELYSSSRPEKLSMSVDSAELVPDGQDIAHVEIQIMDGLGRPVYLADNLVKLTINGPGEILGMENGDAQDLEPYSSGQRKAHHGKLLAYIRAKATAGRIVITAESQDLEPAIVVIRTY